MDCASFVPCWRPTLRSSLRRFPEQHPAELVPYTGSLPSPHDTTTGGSLLTTASNYKAARDEARKTHNRSESPKYWHNSSDAGHAACQRQIGIPPMDHLVEAGIEGHRDYDVKCREAIGDDHAQPERPAIARCVHGHRERDRKKDD